jgi:predicted DNA-binding transcriptional regulator YafY
MDILKYGSDCRVLEPAALVDKVQQQHALALRQYAEK